MDNAAKLKDKIVVIKYGGSSMGRGVESLLRQVIELNNLGMKVILVHGGGPEISSLMEKLNIVPNFIEGLRVTDAETLNIVKMVLVGKINKELVSFINASGGTALGLCGVDGNLLKCKKKYIIKNDGGEKTYIDGGFIGEVESVKVDLLASLLSKGIIPVIAPIGIGDEGENYNINGDDAASAIAQSMGAHIFALVSNIEGVYKDVEDKETKIDKLNGREAQKLIEDGVIKGGMIPKIKCCINAVENGVKSVFIISAEGNNLYDNIVNGHITGTIIEK